MGKYWIAMGWIGWILAWMAFGGVIVLLILELVKS